MAWVLFPVVLVVALLLSLPLLLTARLQPLSFFLVSKHRRRMETEAKAKVVAPVWGTEFIQFLAAQAILPRSILEEYNEFNIFFQIDRGKTASAARN